MARCVHKHLYNYIVEHKLLTSFQSGFVAGDSTIYQLLHTILLLKQLTVEKEYSVI